LTFFLQVLEDGRLTDSQGHTVNFKNTIIIMTSNIDVHEFVEEGQKLDRAEINKQLSMVLRPEFVNRIDEIVVFKNLDLAAIEKIALLQLDKIQKRLKSQGYEISIESDSLKQLIKGIDYNHFGARPLRRLLEDKIETPIAQDIIAGKIKKGNKISWKAKK